MSRPPARSAVDGSFVAMVRQDAAVVELDGEMVVYDGVGGRVHVLDAVATALWRRFDGTVTLDEVIDDLVGAHDTDRDTVAADVVRFTELLADLELLESTGHRGTKATTTKR